MPRGKESSLNFVGYELHSDYIKDVIKHHKMDPTAWRGSAYQGPEIETYPSKTMKHSWWSFDIIGDRKS